MDKISEARMSETVDVWGDPFSWPKHPMNTAETDSFDLYCCPQCEPVSTQSMASSSEDLGAFMTPQAEEKTVLPELEIAGGWQLIHALMKHELGRGRNNGLANEHAIELIEKYSAALKRIQELESGELPEWVESLKVELVDGCVYCGSMGTDHRHGGGRSCGDCCAAHGGLAHDDPDSYKWVKEIVEGRKGLVESTAKLTELLSSSLQSNRELREQLVERKGE
jgi:hypothetical protein